MSITSFIKRVCKQKAVYWERTGQDGFQNPTFDTPIELDVRWIDNSEIASDSQGREFLSNAQVLVTQDLKEQSYLYLGTLSDLPADPDPLDEEKAFEIKRMDRHPTMYSTTFKVFQAYL